MKKVFFLILVIGAMLPTEYMYAQQDGKLTTRTINKEDTPDEGSYKNFRFALGGGYAYWLGKQLESGNAAIDDLYSDLRNGYNLMIDAQYFFDEHSGIALNGSFIKRSVSDDRYSETNKLTYVGPAYVYRWENDKWGFYLNGGFGPIFFNNETKILNREGSLSKVAFGTNLSISGERRLSRYVGAGLKLAVTAGSIKLDNVEERMSVSDLTISGFISFRSK